MDESLPGPWNTYLRGKSIEGEREEEKKREMGGLRAVSKVDKERHENWRVRRKGRECWTQ